MKRGFFIPVDIWDNPGLTLQEKVILAEIVSFTKNGKECYISNAKIAEILGLQLRQAENIFYSLVDRNVVRTSRFDGKNRYVELVEGWQQNARQARNRVRSRLAAECTDDSQQNAKQTRNRVPHTISTDTTYPPILESTNRNLQGKTERKRFSPPTVEDVKQYAESIGHPEFDAERFVNYYTTTGWRLKGGQPIKNWQACVRDWIRRDEKRQQEGNASTTYTSKLNLL